MSSTNGIAAPHAAQNGHQAAEWAEVDICPVCNHRGWCRISSDGNTVNCRRESAGGEARQYKDGGTYYIHDLSGGDRGDRGKADDRPTITKPTEASRRADPDTLNEVYSALLGGLDLSPGHRDALRKRGLPDAEIDRLGYRSWTRFKPVDTLKRLNSRHGDRILTVPGFIPDKNGRLTLSCMPGLLIPVRDVQGRIGGLKSRPDAPLKGKKYLWLSSKKHGGPSSRSSPHVPLGIAGPAKVIRITEGPLKADVATALSGDPTIAADGVSTWQAALKVATALGVETIRIAFDADWRGNPHVAKDTLALADAVIAAGLDLELEDWDPKHKGIDDALAAGEEIRVLSGDEASRALEAIEAQSNGKPETPDAKKAEAKPQEPKLANWDWDDDSSDEEGKPKKAPLRIQTIAATLDVLKPGWPKRVGEQLFIETADRRPVFLNSAQRLFAWVQRFAPVDWTRGANYVTQEQFYEDRRLTATQYDAIETLPHWPPIDNLYYMHEPVPKAGGKLEELINFFSPATTIDGQLIKAFALSLFWGGPAGKRPAFLITGEDGDPEQGRGLGKSTLVDILSEELGDGYIDVSPKDDMATIKTRLLSNEDGRKRVARLDNVKALRFSWADLEGLMTASVISGHSMYQGEGRRPNLLIWTITLNGASLSKDMAQRVVIIKLKRPKRVARWEEKVREFIRAHRGEILGDIRDILMSKTNEIDPQLRWSAWEEGVLAHVGDHEAIAKEIKARQDAVDDDESEKDIVATHFRFMLKIHKRNPNTQVTFIPSIVAADWLSEAMREKYATNRASAFLNGLGISNLKKSDRGTSRGWIWSGHAAACGETAGQLEKPDVETDDKVTVPTP